MAINMKNLPGRVVREVIMFTVGALAFLNEVFIGGQERPFIIAACLALMGLPFVLRGEETIRAVQQHQEEEQVSQKKDIEILKDEVL